MYESEGNILFLRNGGVFELIFLSDGGISFGDVYPNSHIFAILTLSLGFFTFFLPVNIFIF